MLVLKSFPFESLLLPLTLWHKIHVIMGPVFFSSFYHLAAAQWQCSAVAELSQVLKFLPGVLGQYVLLHVGLELSQFSLIAKKDLMLETGVYRAGTKAGRRRVQYCMIFSPDNPDCFYFFYPEWLSFATNRKNCVFHIIIHNISIAEESAANGAQKHDLLFFSAHWETLRVRFSLFVAWVLCLQWEGFSGLSLLL